MPARSRHNSPFGRAAGRLGAAYDGVGPLTLAAVQWPAFRTPVLRLGERTLRHGRDDAADSRRQHPDVANGVVLRDAQDPCRPPTFASIREDESVAPANDAR